MRKIKEKEVTNFKENVLEIFSSHQQWLKTEGTKGSCALFMHTSFEGFDSTGIDISKAVFKNCNFSKSILNGEKLIGTEFNHCNLTEAQISFKEITHVTFEKCELSFANFTAELIEHCALKQCSGLDVSFVKCGIIKTQFNEVELKNANFNSSLIESCTLANCTFNVSDFSYSQIVNSKFEAVVFAGVNFHSTKILFCNFEGTKFKSLVEATGQNFKTFLNFTQFEDCNFKQCSFEESKEFLKEKIKRLKTKKKPNLLKRYLLSILSLKIAFICGLTAMLLTFRLNEIYVLGFGLGFALISSLKTFYAIRMKKLQTNLFGRKSIKIFSAAFYLIPVATIFAIWGSSFRLENFSLSFSILLLGFICLVNTTYALNNLLISKNNK